MKLKLNPTNLNFKGGGGAEEHGIESSCPLKELKENPGISSQKRRSLAFPGPLLHMVQKLHPSIIVAKAQLHLRDWSYDIYQILWWKHQIDANPQIWSTISREEPFLSTTFPYSFHRPPEENGERKTHSFQTKKNSNPRLEGRIASDLSWFFGLYYLSTRNFAENFHPTSHVGRAEIDLKS